MPRYIDKKEADSGGLAAPGRYYAEVKDAKEKISKSSGVPMFEVYFKDVETGSGLCYDNIMLGGRGAGIGVKKLKCLDAVLEEEGKYVLPDDAAELIGRRCCITIKHEKYTDNNGNAKTKAAIDFDVGESFGYEPEGESKKVSTHPGDDEIPF